MADKKDKKDKKDKTDAPEPQLPSSRLRYKAFRKKLKEEGIDKKYQSRRGRHHHHEETEEDDEATKEEKKLKRKAYINEYLRWLKPFRVGLAFIFLFATLGTMLAMLQPLFTQYIFDDILGNNQIGNQEKISRLGVVAIMVVSVLLASQAITTFRSYITTILNAKIQVRIRRRLFNRMVRLSLKELTNMKTGGAISRLTNDVQSMGDLVHMILITPSMAGLRLLISLLIVMLMNWRLGLIFVVVLPIMCLFSFLWVRRIRPIFRAVHEDRALVSGRLTETFGGIRVVRAFQREHKEESDYTVGNHTVVRKSVFDRMQILAVNSVWELMMVLAAMGIILIGAYLAIHGKAKIGEIVAIQQYTFMVIQPVFMIVSTMNQLQQSLASMDRVMEVLDREEDMPDPEDAVAMPAQIEELAFNNVSFAYDDENMVLKDISFKVTGNKTIALVGRSGAGKTTTTDLVARFYDPQKGSITINGIDIRQIKQEDYRSCFGLVQQEVFLFDGTVFDNIAYGVPHATIEEVINAAQQANAHEFVEEFPHGYSSIIGERGVKLSGGQRQRLSIARAFLADPRILILDEATSNLDTESEQLIQAALKELMQQRITFVIAHRLSTITSADTIIVIDEGEIIETGSHEELLAKGDKYFEMIDRQRNLTL